MFLFPRDPTHFSAEVCEGPTPNSRVRPAVRFVPLDPTKTAQGVRNVPGHAAKTAHHKNHNKIGCNLNGKQENSVGAFAAVWN